jgi:signal transduction histidine kinase
MSATDHFVQFYEADEYLVGSVSGFVEAGLEAGETCILVATGDHRKLIETRLHEAGCDVVRARTNNQYIAFDAEELLAKLSGDGRLDRDAFENVVGRLIQQASAGGRRVRVFGEMVAILWAEGKQANAIKLEDFWNALGEKYDFSLFCAYPATQMDGDALAEPFSRVCGRHSRVIPSESYTSLEDESDRLRAIAVLQQKAASLEVEIAERKRLLVMEQLPRTEAENASRTKDEFLATVSHELRTPLNAIIGWATMLAKGALDDDTANRAVDTINRQALIQAQLIEDILDVSRVVSGKLKLAVGPVDAAAVINAAVDAVQPAADAKEIQLEVRLDPSMCHITGDAGRLQQIVWNLLSNAIKFTPDGGRVGISLRGTSTFVEIEVADMGCGIRAENLASIFELFSQEDPSRTRQNGGLGLGLAIARQLTELHGGTISARSDGEGRGSVFTVRLPAGKALAAPSEQGLAFELNRPATGFTAQLAPVLDGVKALLVDDDGDSLGMLKVALGGCRMEIETAGSVTEACDVLEWFSPDILISDIAMPGEDGHMLIRKIRAAGCCVPAIALTAHARVEDRVRALNAGFNMFVPKPVEIDELAAAVANLTAVD